MKCFEVYRPDPPADYQRKGLSNPVNMPQFQGAIFDNGRVVIQWLTPMNSISIFEDWFTFFRIHGHADYNSRIVWLFEQEGEVNKEQLPIPDRI